MNGTKELFFKIDFDIFIISILFFIAGNKSKQVQRKRCGVPGQSENNNSIDDEGEIKLDKRRRVDELRDEVTWDKRIKRCKKKHTWGD